MPVFVSQYMVMLSRDVVARKTARVTRKGRCDHLVTVLVVIENPSRQADRRIVQSVERLRAVRHLDGVPEVMRVEVGQLPIAFSSSPASPAGGGALAIAFAKM